MVIVDLESQVLHHLVPVLDPLLLVLVVKERLLGSGALLPSWVLFVFFILQFLQELVVFFI